MEQVFLQRILVPVDFSVRSGEATRFAQRMAAHFGAEVAALHVIEPAQFDFAMTEPARDVAAAVTEVRLRRAGEKLRRFLAEYDSAEVVALVSEGEAADQILETAAHQNAGLIVMPTQGRSRLRRFLIGSVTAKVLHDAAVPVITGVHLDQREDFPAFRLRRILCAVDLGAQTPCVLRWGAQLAVEFDAALGIVHVTPEPQAARTALAGLAAVIGRKPEVIVKSGEPHKVVTGLAAEFESDLVVIGRGVDESVPGRFKAQAYAIVRQSPCPVLSV